MAIDEAFSDGNPFLSPQGVSQTEVDPADQQDAAAAIRVVEPLVRAGGWITFAGVLMILYGGILILSLIGALVGWLPLWMGILLTQAPARYKEGLRKGDVEMMRDGSDKLRLVAKIWGVTTCIGLGLMVLIYGLLFVLGIAGLLSETM